ncbi:DUF4132 domain-containing protein [Nocardia sp. NPDC127579]|uniref:DUF4132 domain-containing protein n=1 Tax=Nocardia sp. NPDC127579 TaxID=3345402 RepID=UPI0036304966
MSEVLPDLFVDPLWERQARAAAVVERPEPILLAGLEPPLERHLVWEPGEREEWLAQAARLFEYGTRELRAGGGWEAVVAAYRDGKLRYAPTQGHLFGNAPESLVRPLLADWKPEFSGSTNRRDLQVLLARFEFDAYHIVFPHAKSNAYDNGPALLPVLDVEVARLMADWLVRLKSARRIARAWFARHGLAAVPLLTPDALGKRRVPREKATAALSLVAAEHGAERVAAAAGRYGEQAVAAVERILAGDPPPSEPVAKPVRPPKLAWLDRNLLPPVRFRNGTALSAAATENLLGALALSPGVEWMGPAVPHPDLPAALDYCDRASLAEFGWAIFDLWVRARTPARSGWVLDQFYWLADEESVRRLGAMVLRWPGVNTERHAVSVLRSIGTDTALIQLDRISRRAKASGLRATAEKCLAMAARARGLSTDELADRLVPDLGLDAAGTLTLDYGARRFTVGFDAALTPFVIDETGKHRKTLPKPAAADDPDLAPAAYQRFAALKKLARSTVSDQIARLERAMVTGRAWSTGEFDAYLVRHPLIWHLARRLVWTTGEVTFRLAEDRTLSDRADAAIALPDTARVRIAHPVDLGDAVPEWAELFADYELTQPFPQLARPIYTLTEEERATGRIDRFAGIGVPVGALLGLVRHGWERGPTEDGGVQHEIIRRIPHGPTLLIDLAPGIVAGDPYLAPDQKLRAIRFTTPPGAALDPLLASELLTDLARLATNG